jgi:hypothetical protein
MKSCWRRGRTCRSKARFPAPRRAPKVTSTIAQFSEQPQSAVGGQRRAALKAAQVLSQNFAILASGILIGLSEGLQQGRATTERKTKKSE